jgi:hypothetical protein
MTFKTGILTLAGALLAAALVLPTASAQQPSFEFTTSGAPTTPVTPISQAVQIDFDYTYTLKLAPQQVGGITGTAKVQFDVQCPPDKLLVSGSQSKTISITPDPTNTGNEYTGTVTVTITVLREAPGLVPIVCTVNGSVGEVTGTAVPESNDQDDSFTITPDYFALIEAQANSKLGKGGPQKQIPFKLSVTNFGNAQTRVAFSLVQEKTGKWEPLLPEPTLLDAPGGNLQQKEVTFQVATPYKNGWNNAEKGFTLELRPEYAFDSTTTGSPVQVTLLARVRGVYVPTLEPLVMLGAILGAAMVVRSKLD